MEEIRNTEAAETNEKKKGRAVTITLNTLTCIVLILAVVFLIQAFYTNKKMHNNYFGFAVLPVKTESMDIGKGSIKKGDVIFVKLLKGDKKSSLEKGDIVTFKQYIHELDAEALVTHRVLSKENGYYVTRGDANVEGAVENPTFDSVVGVYKGRIGAIGHVGLFFETKAGSFIMVVVPFLLLLLLSVFQFARSLRVYNKQKIETVAETTRSSVLAEEKERMRLEILAELEKEKNPGDKS